MPSTGYNVDRAFFRLAMQETLIIIREYNAFIFRRMPELLVRSPVRAHSLARTHARARSLSIMEPRRALSRPRRALINGDGQIDDFPRAVRRSFLLAIFSNAAF